MAIRTLMFDFGNVLAFFDYGRIYERLGRRLGLSQDQVSQRLGESGFGGAFERIRERRDQRAGIRHEGSRGLETACFRC